MFSIGPGVFVGGIGQREMGRTDRRPAWNFVVSAPGAGVGWLLGWDIMTGVVLGLIISVPSTMVLSRLLIDRSELQSEYGRVMIGITLVEDVAVVVLTILMPVLVTLSPSHLLGVGKGAGRCAGKILVPPMLARIARGNNNELLLMLPATCLGTAALAEAVGQVSRLGSVRCDLMVSASRFAHRALDQMLLLRDAFVALFSRDRRSPDQSTKLAVLSSVLACDSLTGDRGKVHRLNGSGEAVPVSFRTAILVGVGSPLLVQVARKWG
jgi:CPA2 family monovalent cation:H+ antiporter-2